MRTGAITVSSEGEVTLPPGDYDGNGLFDAAFYLDTAAGWTVMASTYGYVPVNVGMGGAGFVPVR